MFRKVFTAAFRNLRRNPVYAAINVLGLALGMASGTAMLSFVLYETSFDRFHGVLAPNAAGREHIVPGPRPEDAGPVAACSHAAQTHAPKPAYRLTWARLLARVFRVDVTVCPACGGKMKVIASLTDPHAIRTYLDGAGLTSHPPPVAPPRPLPQTQFEFTKPARPAPRRQALHGTSGHVSPPASRSAAFRSEITRSVPPLPPHDAPATRHLPLQTLTNAMKHTRQAAADLAPLINSPIILPIRCWSFGIPTS